LTSAYDPKRPRVHPNVSAVAYVAARAPDAEEDYTALAKAFSSAACISRHHIRLR